jgi:hypothetical protein
VEKELREVSRALAAALTRMKSLESRQAVAQAEALSDVLNGAISDVALVRARAAAKLREDANLSLAELAEVLEISRARAAQLVRVAESKSGN